jgi:hypothetical protein
VKIAKYLEKNSLLDLVCKKVKGFSEMYPNANSRRAKMFGFISERIGGTSFMPLILDATCLQKLATKVEDLEFKDVASFDQFLQTIK